MRLLPRCSSIAIVVMLATTRLAAERLPIRVLTTADGLPRDQLECVRSDARGFVWFCTGDGLVRFDGHTAVTFGRAEGLAPPSVRAFLIARDGRYWTGADAGLFEFTPSLPDARRRFLEHKRDDGERTGAVNALAESMDHAVWIGAGRGLFRLARAADGVHIQEVDIGLPRDTENDRIVRAVLEDEGGTLWVGAGSGLYARRPDGRTRRLTTRDGLPVDEVWALALDERGRVWAATRQGLAEVDRAAVERDAGPIVQRVYTSQDGLPASNVKSLHSEGRTLWVGTVAGIAEAAMGPDGLAVGRAIRGFYAKSIASDPRGDIWMASEDGARRFTRRGFTTYVKEDGLAAPLASAVTESRTGEVCATTHVGRFALSCFDGERFRQVPVPAAQSVEDPGWGWSQLTLQDRQGRWWVPTGEGLLRFHAGAPSTLAAAHPDAVYDTRQGLRSNSIFRLFEDSQGGIWVATFAEAGNGIARIDAASGALRAFNTGDGLPDRLPIVHSFAEDRAGAVWVGLEQGRLFRFRQGRFEEIPLYADLERVMGAPRNWTTDHLRSLLVDGRGRLWLASTAAGLGRLDDPSTASPAFRWYGIRDGLSSETVWSITEDGSGALFVGTARGIDRLDPATGLVAHYTSEEGVPRGEILGAVRDRAGAIWFATSGGVARLAPTRQDVQVPPVTLVTGIRVGGAPVVIDADGATRVESVIVEPNDRSIEIEYVSPGSRAADGLRYQHQLDGAEPGWTTADNRAVAFVGAAPGRHRFVVRAALASGLVGEPAEVRFTVLAPVWRRWWFLMLMGTAVASLALIVHRARVSRLLEIERVRSRIATDLHDEVGASLSRIAILSEVVRQQAEPVLPDAVHTLTAIADNAREVIDDMSDVVWFVDPRFDNLHQVIARVRTLASDLFEGSGTSWSFEGTAEVSGIVLTSDTRRQVYLILKEALTNVLRHADAAHVALRVAVSGRRLHVEIVDDGRGVDGKRARDSEGSGRGLASMRARATALGGELSVTQGAGGRGTRVSLTLPM